MTHITNKDISYQPFVINDIAVVELLIEFRYKYDENLFLEDGSMFYVTGVKPVNQELVATYLSLDETIKGCGFTDQQLQLIKLVEQGYTHREIASIIKVENQNVNKMLKTVYKAIVKENERQWRKVHYTHTLGLKTKQCNECKEDLPATDEFFQSRSKIVGDGFYNICKLCENIKKKSN